MGPIALPTRANGVEAAFGRASDHPPREGAGAAQRLRAQIHELGKTNKGFEISGLRAFLRDQTPKNPRGFGLWRKWLVFRRLLKTAMPRDFRDHGWMRACSDSHFHRGWKRATPGASGKSHGAPYFKRLHTARARSDAQQGRNPARQRKAIAPRSF